MGWTPEQIAILKEQYGRGKTASEIGALIGKSRNSIIGKGYRLKLSTKTIKKNNNFKKVSQEQESGPQQKRKIYRSKFKSLLIDKNFEPENPKSLEELNDEVCRWPIGHPSDGPSFYFCGRKSMKDFSYCKLHILYAFQTRDKKEDLLNNEEEVPKFIEKKIKSA